MKRTKLLFTMLIALILFSACAPKPIHIHSLNGWKIVYNDNDKLRELCGIWAIGCADWNTKTIYCTEWDFETCGHEMHHITNGRHSDWKF
ncbi:hypothetical protein LCGC14_1290940 [marine sediment metagenome]|uniref:Lipoprotein n=1 Tax=marine sediment metagenome TaxID=412755 RepID=A0A0F9NVB4_9ZZZZ